MTRIKSDCGSAEFCVELARLDRAVIRAEALPGTLGFLIKDYRRSPFWSGLAHATRISYDRVFEVLKPLHAMPLVELSPGWVAALRDEVAEKRGR
jgi:hypothetical protein